MDPTLQLLLTVFGGALVAAFAGIVGAWIQSRREHVKWLRDRRLDAYVAVLSNLDDSHTAKVSLESLRAWVPRDAVEAEKRGAAIEVEEGRLLLAVSDHGTKIAALQVVGPPAVSQAVNAEIVGDHDRDRNAVLTAMRAALSLKD